MLILQASWGVNDKPLTSPTSQIPLVDLVDEAKNGDKKNTSLPAVTLEGGQQASTLTESLCSNFGEDTFTVFNVGQGNCNLYVPGDPKAAIVLYDCGSDKSPEGSGCKDLYLNISKEIEKHLSRMEMKKLIVVVSHNNRDHKSGLENVISFLEMKNIPKLEINYFFGGNEDTWDDFLKKYHGTKYFASSLNKLQDIGVGSTYVATPVVWGEGSSKENQSTLVLRVSNLENSVLMTGDIESEIPEMSSQTTVVVSPHHGSETGANDDKSIKKMNPRNIVFSSAFKRGWEHPKAVTVAKYFELAPLQVAPLHLIEYFDSIGNSNSDSEKMMVELPHHETMSSKKFYFAFTKKGAYHTRTNGNVKFVFTSPMQIIFSPPSLSIFPSILQNLTVLNFSDFNLTSDDVDYLAKEWLNLKCLTKVNLRRNAIDLNISRTHLERLLAERSGVKDGFKLYLEPQYARPTDMHVKVEGKGLVFPLGDYDRGYSIGSIENKTEQNPTKPSGKKAGIYSNGDIRNPKYWYNEEDISKLLRAFIPRMQTISGPDIPIENSFFCLNSVYIFPPSEKYKLHETVNAFFVLNRGLNAQTILIPLNIGGLHWITLCLEYLGTGRVSLTYVESLKTDDCHELESKNNTKLVEIEKELKKSSHFENSIPLANEDVMFVV